MKLWVCCISLAAISAAPAAAQDVPPIPDPASITVPDLSSTDPSVVSNGYKFFVFRKPGVDFSTAAQDIAECRSFLVSGAGRGLPSFVPWVEPVNRQAQNDIIISSPYGAAGIAIEGMMKAGMAAIILPKMERGLRNNKMRRCMGPRGYRRFAVPESAWNAMNEGDDELEMVLMQAKVASSDTPGLVEVTEKGESMMRLLCALAALMLASPSLARDADGVIQHRIAPARLDPAKAYLLLQTSTAKSGMMSIEHALLRLPTQAETEAYRRAKQAAYDEALPKLSAKAKDGNVPSLDQFAFEYNGPLNAFATKRGDFLVDGEMRTLLIEVPPGTYILYGIAVSSRALATCNCLGTVSFAAKPGVITDMGALYADKVHKPSPVPHLEDNLGPSMFQYGFIMGQALVPASASSPVPASLRALPIERAEYHAVGLFHEPGAGSINRLAPVPGVLRYDGGRVIDERTGQPAQ